MGAGVAAFSILEAWCGRPFRPFENRAVFRLLQVGSSYMSPLGLACCWDAPPELIACFLKHGADVNSKLSLGCSSLAVFFVLEISQKVSGALFGAFSKETNRESAQVIPQQHVPAVRPWKRNPGALRKSQELPTISGAVFVERGLSAAGEQTPTSLGALKSFSRFSSPLQSHVQR